MTAPPAGRSVPGPRPVPAPARPTLICPLPAYGHWTVHPVRPTEAYPADGTPVVLSFCRLHEFTVRVDADKLAASKDGPHRAHRSDLPSRQLHVRCSAAAATASSVGSCDAERIRQRGDGALNALHGLVYLTDSSRIGELLGNEQEVLAALTAAAEYAADAVATVASRIAVRSAPQRAVSS